VEVDEDESNSYSYSEYDNEEDDSESDGYDDVDDDDDSDGDSDGGANTASKKKSVLMVPMVPADKKRCKQCGSSETPLWRKNDAGESLCNACGLYFKHYKKPRPMKLVQAPMVPKKVWKIPKDGIMACLKCGTLSTPIWRRGPEGDLLCNACGLHRLKEKKKGQRKTGSGRKKKRAAPTLAAPVAPLSPATAEFLGRVLEAAHGVD